MKICYMTNIKISLLFGLSIFKKFRIIISKLEKIKHGERKQKTKKIKINNTKEKNYCKL